MAMRTNLSYDELSQLSNFFDRFEYLKLSGVVGQETFGHDRYLNQGFYTSRAWRSLRSHIIARDLGCDLGVPGYEIHDKIIIHHINPITPDDFIGESPAMVDPNNLISVSHDTHNAIHFGDINLLPREYSPRSPGDTTLW